MTGMGKDGAENITKLYTEGSRTIGQDEGSSVVYGMQGKWAELWCR